MSFSSLAKDCLTHKRIRSQDEYMALLAAITASIGTITLRRGKGMGVKYTTEAHQVAKLISKCASKLYRVESELTVHETSSGKTGRSSVLSLFGTDVEKLLYDSGLLTSDEYAPPVFDENSLRIYLRGVFLACGSITDPNKSYHLEMVCRNKSAAVNVKNYAYGFGIDVKYTKRKDNHIAYLKDSESISSFLSLIGADDTVLEFENVRAYRDTRNYANRTRNCDMANIEKSNNAARKQVAEMEYLLSHIKGDLPQHLYETAAVRLRYPEATLTELADILGVGKSGANHRIQKLLEIAKELRGREKQ